MKWTERMERDRVEGEARHRVSTSDIPLAVVEEPINFRHNQWGHSKAYLIFHLNEAKKRGFKIVGEFR